MNQKSSSSLIHIRNNFHSKILFESSKKLILFHLSIFFKTSSQISEANFINTPERNIFHPFLPRSVKFNAIERLSSSPRLAYFNARCFLSARTYTRPKSGGGGRRGAPWKRRSVDIDAGTPSKTLASLWSMSDRRPDSRNSFDRWRVDPIPRHVNN